MHDNVLGPVAFVFALVLSACVLVIQATVAPNLIHQFASRNYLKTTGEITLCEVERRGSGGRRETHAVNVRYHYAVAGEGFLGTQIRYNDKIHPPGLKWARSWVAAHPIGSPVQVFYNPNHPADALLTSGIEATDLADEMFATVFTAIAIVVWLGPVSWLRWLIIRPIAGGVRIWRESDRVQARLPRFMPILVAAATTVFLAFFSVFYLGTNPPLAKAMAVVCTVFGIGVVVYCWGRLAIRSGKYDLIIDEVARTVGLPKTFGRKERVTIAFSDVNAISVVELSRRKSNLYVPTIQTRGKALQLVRWYDQNRAEAFVAWLRKQVGSHAK